jgi:hypothetical protein
MAGWAPAVDFRHYIGYMVGAFCVAVYAAIFLYIYKDGEFERTMRRRAEQSRVGAAAPKGDLSDDEYEGSKKDR